MLIPLGIFAGAGGAAGSFDLLETTTLTGSQASVTFSNLNSNYGSTYQHLQIRFVARTTSTGIEYTNGRIRLNGDSGSNYAWHELRNLTGSVTSTAGSSDDKIATYWVNAGSVSGNYQAGIIDFLDPFETTKTKTIRMFDGAILSTSAWNCWSILRSGLWNNTAALTSVELGMASNNWAIGSRFSLYGIKAA